VPSDPLVDRLRAAGCVFAEDEARLLRAAAESSAELDALVARRVDGAPLEALLGWAEFCGLRIAVDPGVFVPRQRTAFLVAQAVRRLGVATPAACGQRPGGRARIGDGPGAVVVDLCCGTGAIGAAIAAAVPGVEVHAADVDPAAVACGRRNLPRVYQGDLYAALPDHLRGRVDLLVVNAPYVPTAAIATMPPEARDHEPRVALDGGADGLDVQRRVAADAPAWLRPGGALLIETGADQAPHTAELFAAAGLVPHVAYADDATVVIGER
jgi:release factor glutamine methyltransferase